MLCLACCFLQMMPNDCFFSHNFSFQVKRSEEHTSELQSLAYLVCRLLLEKKKISEALQLCVSISHLKIIEQPPSPSCPPPLCVCVMFIVASSRCRLVRLAAVANRSSFLPT